MRELALIFDFGNVVGFFDHERSFEWFARRLELDSRLLRERVLHREGLELFRRFECGAIGPEEFAAEIMALAEFKLPYEEFVQGWVDIFWPNETVALLVACLKEEGFSLVLGSNTNVLHSTHYRRQFAETLRHFDRLVLSHEVGCMKPDRGFYLACVEAARRPASACVFIDDVAENVEGARRAGLIALEYTDTPTLVAQLHGLGIACTSAFSPGPQATTHSQPRGSPHPLSSEPLSG